MPEKAAYRRHLQSSADLITDYEATRAGFIALALEKNRRATPIVEQARALQTVASEARNPHDLLQLKDIQAALLTAAGVSDKAASHLQPQDKVQAIQGLIDNFLGPAGPKFVEELVFRFLLTRGDALGGSMRNVAGALAQRKLNRALISTLALAGIRYHWLDAESNLWMPAPTDDSSLELRYKGLSWTQGRRKRTLLYNVTVPIVKNNVDVCLFKVGVEKLSPEIIREPANYLALGELKGGIDPAGADEHWKTARTALNRIREAFIAAQTSPHNFFIGAAIEKSMAREIWMQLEEGSLGNAANLTNDRQVTSISHWLCSL